MKLKLRYYQKNAYNDFFNYTANNWGKNPIVVLPTGSGKSILMAYIVNHMLEYKDTRVLLLTHQRQLISQNVLELRDNFENDLFMDIGVYSAGLKRRDTSNRIIFGGIQSVYKIAWELGWFDLILVDECHLINNKKSGMYRTFLAEMKKINSKVIIGGMSATPFRMRTGLLTEGEDALFDDICHETSVKELIEPDHYRNTDKTQYLCNLISKNAINKADISNVHIRGGEYVPKEMEQAFQENDLVCRAVKEIKECSSDRKKILTFTAGIKHCEEVTDKMLAQGLDARFIHSKQSDEINEKNIKDFKNGVYKYLNNVSVLTTGFNEKAIDCIVFLRSTMSPGLYSQICGRGLRIHPDKKDCLILDMGSNILRHGPIDKIEVKKKKDGTFEVQTAPQKECPECQYLMHATIMECPECGYLFPQKDKHEDEASEASVISEWQKPETYDVESVEYSRHQKSGKPDSLCVDYYISEIIKYSQWVCIEHEGFAKRKAYQWLDRVTDLNVGSVDEALWKCEDFLQPSQIIVDFNGKFPTIIGYIYEEPKEPEVNDEVLEKVIF